MDKMIMAVIPRDEAESVLDALINAGFTATFTETKGGMLRQSQYTLFTAVHTKDVEKVCEIIKKNCMSEVDLDDDALARQELAEDSGGARVGGAILFIWELKSTTIY